MQNRCDDQNNYVPVKLDFSTVLIYKKHFFYENNDPSVKFEMSEP